MCVFIYTSALQTLSDHIQAKLEDPTTSDEISTQICQNLTLFKELTSAKVGDRIFQTGEYMNLAWSSLNRMLVIACINHLVINEKADEYIKTPTSKPYNDTITEYFGEKLNDRDYEVIINSKLNQAIQDDELVSEADEPEK